MHLSVAAALAVLLLPLAVLLALLAPRLARSAVALCRPHMRALPRAPPSARSLHPLLQPLLGSGDWGHVATARGLTAREAVDALCAARRASGGVFLTRAEFGMPVVVVMDGDAIQRLMVTSSYRYNKMQQTRRMYGPLIGLDGLLLASGEQHRRLRARVGRTMHHEAVIAFSGIFLEEAARLRAFFEVHCGAGDKPLRLQHGVGAATCRTIVRAYFPEEVLSGGRVDRLMVLYQQVFKDVGSVARELMLQKILWFLPAAWITSRAVVKRGIRREAEVMLADAKRLQAERKAAGEASVTRASLRSGELPAKSMASSLLDEKGTKLTSREQVDNFLTFMTAGQVTTAVSLAYAVWRLAKHPMWQARVQAELDGCAAWRDESRSAADRVEAVCALPVLTRVLKESLRMYPPIPLTTRVVEEEDTLCGYILAPGTVVVVPTLAIHCDETIWEDPWTFDPDRFVPEREAARDKMAWLPFLLGPRGCIGQRFALREMAVMCADLVYSFDLFVDPEAAEFVPRCVGINAHPDVSVFARPRTPNR
jgi:cytochrome P450